METKAEIRKYIAQKKEQFTLEEKIILSEKIISRIEALPLFISSFRILCYHSLPDEVYTHAFIEKWSQKKEILLPVVQQDILYIRKYEQKEKCKTGTFQILEPSGKDIQNLQSIDLVLLPGIAFDKKGNRLGRGKGYYDKLLTQISAPKAGICFGFQLMDNLPADEWDIPMNMIFTEKNMLIIEN